MNGSRSLSSSCSNSLVVAKDQSREEGAERRAESHHLHQHGDGHAAHEERRGGEEFPEARARDGPQQRHDDEAAHDDHGGDRAGHRERLHPARQMCDATRFVRRGRVGRAEERQQRQDWDD